MIITIKFVADTNILKFHISEFMMMRVKMSEIQTLAKTERRVKIWSNKQVIHPNFECKLKLKL